MIRYVKHSGLVVTLPDTVIVKLVDAVRAEIYGVGVTFDVLQVTLSAVPSVVSSCTNISLLAVTAVVSTTTVDALAATTTMPAAADPQAAGDAALWQLVAVHT